MPKDYIIKKYLINRLDSLGYYYWYPARTKFKSQIDVFGAFDIIAFKNDFIRYIQFTDYTNHSHRVKKVQSFLKRTNFGGRSEVWSWHSTKRYFRREVIYKDNVRKLIELK